MSDFSLPMIYVATSGTLASSGSTDALTPAQIGVYLPDYTIATTGNIAAAKYIYIAQGRNVGEVTQESKKSDKIDKNKIIAWYRTTAESDVTGEIVTVSNFHVQCGETITISLRAHSKYIETLFYNGLQKSITVQAPCCNCGDSPCADIAAVDTQALVDAIVNKGNAGGNDFLGAQDAAPLSKFFSFSRTGTGASSVLVITAKPLDVYGNACDPTAFPYEYDRLWFRAWAIAGPATSQDFIVYDKCDQVATVTVTSRATYPKGSSAEVLQLEKNYYSYQTPAFKAFYSEPVYNGNLIFNTVAGTFYDLYYIKYKAYDNYNETNWQDAVVMDNTIIVAFPTGTGSTFQTLLETYLGTSVDESGVNITTTTTTSTTSTTTTTTSTLIP